MLMQPVRILAIAPVLGPARRLHVRGAPGLRPERAQERRRVRRARAHFEIVGLQQGATLRAPVALERGDDLLKAEHPWRVWREGLDFTGRSARRATSNRGSPLPSMKTPGRYRSRACKSESLAVGAISARRAGFGRIEGAERGSALAGTLGLRGRAKRQRVLGRDAAQGGRHEAERRRR